MSSDNIVKLNIGGTLFQTSKSTLTKFDGFFKTLLETEIPVTKDDSGAIFIDRSAKHFDLILNFMRDGHVDIPISEDDRRQLLKEAQYYLLTGLVELCNVKVPMKISETSNKLPVIESDNHMLQIITNPEKPVVIINYRTGNWGEIFHSTTGIQFVEKHKSRFDVYFMPLHGDGWNWNYSIHDKTPNSYAIFTASMQFTRFIENLERIMDNFLKTDSVFFGDRWHRSPK